MIAYVSGKQPSPGQIANQRRHMARRLALQALYQWQMTGYSATEILDQFEKDRDYHKADAAFFDELVRGVISRQPELDGQLAAYLPRDIELIDAIERAVLRLAAYELATHQETPYRVVLNEAIGLTKVFGAVGAHKFVNGVLDKLWRQLRPMEARLEAKS